ncbi:Coatomer subunit gamma-2 [Clydaea vesicula]|uniref:Coatomer subunit gamma n=1 Tax=Clydaea vesicula TaxID=447962 RepID=A0AAD5U0L4_9FUNG|nr:Coatomer subunit gamma-2 [Clydaea vesicula]
MKKDDEQYGDGIFSSCDKSVTLQEAKAFNETPINPRKCRQMVYLVIKELSNIAEDVIMVTSSLTKDMNAKSDVVYRANAIRALCKITDGTMLQSIERFLKQAIVDKNPSVSSAALVSSLNLFSQTPQTKEVVKRWVNEVQEAINAKGVITQYHALGLIYQIKQHDRMAVTKLVQNYSKGSGLKSSFAHCMLVRYLAKIISDDENDNSGSRAMFDLLESWLRHKNDMVVYEAARAICTLPNVSQKELFPAVSALQLMLLNTKPTLRFAAIRTLNKLALSHPVAVWPCNLDMENLITDSNRSIATFAITTLLKTGTEASVDRLMKQITGFMSEISDEFKVIVIDAIRSLCLKFPSKQSLMLNFLSNVLRDEGGYEYKRAIVEAIFDIIYHVPDSKEYALGHLCEFIEDCEFPKLAVRILHLIGTEGPKTAQPGKYIRYIYNRVILENATIRAAAVSSLAKFAFKCENLKPRIKVLLQRCLDDSDDEVRDRAAMYLKVLENNEMSIKYVGDDTSYSWPALERNILNYINDTEAHLEPFDITSTPIVTKAQEEGERLRIKANAQEAIAQGPGKSKITPTSSAPAGSAPAVENVDLQTRYRMEMESIPALAVLGSLFKSSKVVELTESETEYVVGCIKHVYDKHIVFQFNCKNTISEFQLDNVFVQMALQPEEEEEVGLRFKFQLNVPKLQFDKVESFYSCWEIVGSNGSPQASFSNTLRFLVKEFDINSGEVDEEGYEDEYLLEDVDVTLADYFQPLYLSDFRKSWEEAGSQNEVIETYSLTAVQSIKAAVSTVIDLLGMQPNEQTQHVKEKATTHTLILSGTYFIGLINCFVRCRCAFDPSSGVTMELTARSNNRNVNEKIVNCIS